MNGGINPLDQSLDSNMDETRIEFGDLDQTLLEQQHAAPVSIRKVDGAPITTIQIDFDPKQADTPLSELVAQIFFEINKLNLNCEPSIHVIAPGTGIPFGVSCAIMAHLKCSFGEIKVFCPTSQGFETVSI